MSRSVVCRLPAGRSTLWRLMTRAISDTLSPCWRSVRDGTSMRIWWSENPLMSTCVTWGMRRSRSFMSSA